MLPTHIVEELVGGPGASGFHVFVSFLNTPNGFFKILLLPFKVSGQGLIESVRRGLTTSASKFFQFSLALGFKRYGRLHKALPESHPKAPYQAWSKRFCRLTADPASVANLPGFLQRRY